MIKFNNNAYLSLVGINKVQNNKNQLNKNFNIYMARPLSKDTVSFKSKNTTNEYYSKNAEVYFNQTVNVDMSKAYSNFLKYIPEGGKILDAGSGSGRDTKNFKDMGYEVEAFDGCKELCDISSEFLGQKVHNLRFNEVNFENEFDGVWACASLLHLPKNEMDDAVDRLSKSLKSGGVLFASLKSGDGESVDDKGRFFSYYDEDEFKQLLKKHKELELIDIYKNEDKLGRKDQSWISFIIKKSDKNT